MWLHKGLQGLASHRVQGKMDKQLSSLSPKGELLSEDSEVTDRPHTLVNWKS